jgi:hypothetical protein
MYLVHLAIVPLVLCRAGAALAQVPKPMGEASCRANVTSALTHDGGIGIPEEVPLPRASAAGTRQQLIGECTRYIRKYGEFPEDCPCPLR